MEENSTSNPTTENVNDDNLIDVIETHYEETCEDKSLKLALQQLESINSSSRRKKKNEIGSVVCTKKIQTSTLDNNDLIAILQGDDISSDENVNKAAIKEEVIIEGEGQFEVLDIEENDDAYKPNSVESFNKAMPQKNRKRKQDFKSDLVSSLAQEWSDDDESDISKITNTEEEPPLIKCESLDIKIPQITPFKRTRVIKRKIIWDPDAPETQFSYASLIQPKNKTSPNQIKDPNKKRVTSPIRRKLVNSPADKKQETIEKKQKAIVPIKKKKLTEIDRLLGDEGAANMLNSLEQQAEVSTVYENKNVSNFKTINYRHFSE